MFAFLRRSPVPQPVGRRFTGAGKAVLAGYAASALFAVDTRTSMVYQLFSFLLAAFGLSVALGSCLWPRVRLTRELPPRGVVGEELAYTVRVTGRSRFAQRGLALFEDPDYPALAVLRRLDKRKGLFRRLPLLGKRLERIGRWHTLLRKPSAVFTPGLVERVDRGETREATLRLTPLLRGYLPLAGVTVGRTDPLGIFRALGHLDAPARLLALPRRYATGRPVLPPAPGGRGARRQESHSAPPAAKWARGEGQEFFTVREYRTGDSPRRIHWPSFARTGYPVVKEFTEEHFLRRLLVLDTALTDAGVTFREAGQLFEAAVSVAASLATAREPWLDGLVLGSRARLYPPGTGHGQVEGMLEELALVQPEGVDGAGETTRTFRDCARTVLRHAPECSGLFLVLLALDEAREELLARLRAMDRAVLALVVRPEGRLGAPLRVEREGELLRVVSLDVGNLGAGLAALFEASAPTEGRS